MICAVGFCLPLYQYCVGNKKHSLCQGKGYIAFASVSNNMVTLQLLSLHQYVIVTQPFLGKTLKNRQNYAIICIIISWLFGLFVACIQFLKWSSNYKKQFGFVREQDFISERLTDRIYFIFLFLICYVIPIVLILYSGCTGITATSHQSADQGTETATGGVL